MTAAFLFELVTLGVKPATFAKCAGVIDHRVQAGS